MAKIKKIKKSLDKPYKICYNKYVKRKEVVSHQKALKKLKKVLDKEN